MCVFVQVRMYQFSATPKHIECVVFECVGGRDNNQGLDIKVCCTVLELCCPPSRGSLPAWHAFYHTNSVSVLRHAVLLSCVLCCESVGSREHVCCCAVLYTVLYTVLRHDRGMTVHGVCRSLQGSSCGC